MKNTKSQKRKYYKNILRYFFDKFVSVGFDPRILFSYKNYFKYLKQKKKWLKNGGKIDKNHIILTDYQDKAGVASGHYFHQDLLVASLIFKNNPKRHLDIGSRVDGFVAHVASFREIEVLDIRKMESSEHEQIKYIQSDFMENNKYGNSDSVSCLHAIEHFGLGRYGDKIDKDGHIKGINNLISLLDKSGRLYISFPIGVKDEIHFNSHRVFHPESILRFPGIVKYMKLERFDFVDDHGKLHKNKKIKDSFGKVSYGCGIYTFLKLKS